MAATTGIFATSPVAGVNYYSLSSTPLFAKLTANSGSDGSKHIYGLLAAALGSIATCGIGTAGSITAVGSTTATYIMNIVGGGASGQYCWIKQRTI
jgi:hypothetical protein